MATPQRDEQCVDRIAKDVYEDYGRKHNNLHLPVLIAREKAEAVYDCVVEVLGNISMGGQITGTMVEAYLDKVRSAGRSKKEIDFDKLKTNMHKDTADSAKALPGNDHIFKGTRDSIDNGISWFTDSPTSQVNAASIDTTQRERLHATSNTLYPSLTR